MLNISEDGEFNDGRNKCEEVYYCCNCDRISNLCQGNPISNSWFGLGHSSRSSGLRQSYEMKTKQRWILMFFVICSILVVLLLLGTGGGGKSQKGLKIHLDLDQLTERAKCPSCFGVKLCPDIVRKKLLLSDWTRYTITKLANKKNVFYGDWDDRGRERKVVLKKLAHDHELDELDKMICERHGQTGCDVSDSVQYLITEYSHHSEITDGLEILHGEKIGKGSDILICPSHRKMEFLVEAANKFQKGQNKKTILANVLTMILLNPEPLILEAFTAYDEWPFPEYHGACGRIVVEEFVGRPLSQYNDESFETRAYLAKQLLEMANKFEENPSGFILYMTDPIPDNFAVNEHSHILKMVDLENIIIVDKEELIKSKAKDADKLLVSEAVDCKEDGVATKCFAFNQQDLCERRLTDHNYFAVCAGIIAPDPLTPGFPQGLLHSIPEGDKFKLKGLTELVQQCKDPSQGPLNLNRIQAAQKLIHLLDLYLKSES